MFMNSLLLHIINSLLPIIPETRGFAVKRFLFKLAGANIGRNVRICSSVRIIGAGMLTIGDNTWVGHRTLIVASSMIKIGNNVDIAPNVFIGNGTHEITPERDRIADIELSKDIIIGDGCWLCVNSTILPGVTIGSKCVVAAGSVVTKSFDDKLLIAGVPAVTKKNL